MNRKGFTVLELLAVILVVALLFTIAVPTIMKFMKKGTKAYYVSLESEVKVAGVDYVETYRSLLPQNIGHVAVIPLSELVSNKYIDPVVDEKGNECTGKVTIKKVKTDSYEYYSCLQCGEYYSSAEENCQYSVYDNEYVDSGDYRIVVPQEYYEVEQTKDFTAPLAEVYYKEDPVPIKTDLEGDPSKLKTNKLGTYDIVYYYHGAKKIIQVKVIDTTKPSKVQVVMRYTDVNGKSYKGNWFSGNVYVSYKATDYTKEGIKGSGIDHYEVSTDGVNFVTLDNENQVDFKKLSASEQTMIKEGDYVRYVRAVDKDGNIGPVNSYRTKIDKTKPTCSWAGESTQWQPNLNLPASQRVNARTIVATCADSVSDCTDATKSKTWIEENSVKTKKLSYTMEDLAGNTQVCEKTVNVYIDKTKPSISAKDLPLGTEDYHFADNAKGNLTLTCNYSPCTVTCDPADSRKTSVYDVTCTITSEVGLSATDTFKAKHQYTVSGHTITDANWCGTHSCNCYNYSYCCDGRICSGDNCSCPGGGDNSSCPGSCWHYRGCCSSCSGTKCSQCANSCTVYDCTDEAVHNNGAKRSTSDSTCYYR